MSDTVEYTLSVFGGLNTSMQPADLPPGLSPACFDVCFNPGSFQTRPPLARSATLGTASQILYFHTYVRPDGSVVQLEFDSLGGIYADGVKIAQTKAGNRFHATNAFGKCFIAISDGLHGQDVPLQVDANLNVDRVSQDGPGGPVTVTNYAIPAQALVTGASGASIAISNAQPINPQQVQTGGGYDNTGYDPPQYTTYYTALRVTTATAHGLSVGAVVNITGNSQYNVSGATVQTVESTTVFDIAYQTQSSALGTGGNVVAASALLVRSNGQVTATTAAPHQLKTGYRVTIDGLADASLSITKAVIANDTQAGIATITTPTPHGFVPGNQITILNVPLTNVGGSVTAWNTSSSSTSGEQTLQFTTAQPHGLRVGDQVVESTNGGYKRQHPVDTVLDATNFTVLTTNASGSGTSNATLTAAWPADSGQTFTVQGIPSVTTFTIALSGPSEEWDGGTIHYPWDGTFYVSTVPSATTFTYAQGGPDATVQSGSGTVTPLGQIAPGVHTFWPVFRTRQGYLTRPGPPVKINASGNQYLFFSNIPIGPPNVVARYIVGTGANGSRRFVIDVPYQDGTQVIGTSTVVPDNVTTSAIMDFSDQALEDSTAVDVPGNDLFSLNVLDSVLGFYNYAGRLVAWGMRNTLTRLYNLGFEGGVQASAPNSPLGWNIGTPGTLVAGDYGMAFRFGAAGTAGAISQPIYQDQFGAPILEPQVQYSFRAWATGPITADLYSPSAGVLATANLNAQNAFSFGLFSAKTPVTIPPDTVLRVYTSVLGTSVDEIRLVNTAAPYRLQAQASYVQNPESFSGVTGYFGPDGPLPVRAVYNRRDVLNLLTAGPNGQRYETEDSASGEPSSWSIRTMSSKCGAVSVWGNASFEDWEVWASDTGLRIDVGQVDKISQEVQTFWDSINPQYRHLTCVSNDPYTRRVYILAATGDSTVTNACMTMDYRELSTASLLENAGTLKISGSGRVVTTDLTRKWCQWSIQAMYCGLRYFRSGLAQMTFAGGGSVSRGTTYYLREDDLSGIDIDYGPFWYTFQYPTFFLLDADTAQQLRLGAHRLTHLLITANVSGVGSTYLIPAVDELSNQKKLTASVKVFTPMPRDVEFGVWISGERVSYTFRAQPVGVQPFTATAQAGIRVSSVTVGMVTEPYAPVRQFNG